MQTFKIQITVAVCVMIHENIILGFAVALLSLFIDKYVLWLKILWEKEIYRSSMSQVIWSLVTM